MSRLACLLADPADPFTDTVAIELSEVFPSVRVLTREEAVPPCSLLVADLDYAAAPREGERRIGYAREERTAPFPVLRRPFPITELRRLLTAPPGERGLTPSADFRTVTLGGETVSLTEREAVLLRLLYEAKGAPVARIRLARAAFPEAEDPSGSLSVYIHYLRKKLERSGKRLLHAHRGGGYSLLID